MSNQEYCQKLYQDYVATSQEFLSLNRELPHTTGEERIDKQSRYTTIRKQWQTAVRKYWDFIELLKAHSINPNDEVQLS
jgi:hypothetical protein